MTKSNQACPLLYILFLCVFLYGPFNCISFHKFSRQLSVFSLCFLPVLSPPCWFFRLFVFLRKSPSVLTVYSETEEDKWASGPTGTDVTCARVKRDPPIGWNWESVCVSSSSSSSSDVCVYVCMYVCMHEWMNEWMNEWMSVRIWVRICVVSFVGYEVYLKSVYRLVTESCVLREVPSGENTELKPSPFKDWSKSVHSHTCYAYWQGFFPCLFLPFRSIHLREPVWP